MKQIKSILLITAILLSAALSIEAKVPTEVSTAIEKGDASTLTSYLNSNVELQIENKNDIFSKQQASGILGDFFKRNSAQSFKILHESEKDATSFLIGTLQTSTGSYRVSILMRNENNKNIIQQIRISSSNNQ